MKHRGHMCKKQKAIPRFYRFVDFLYVIWAYTEDMLVNTPKKYKVQGTKLIK